MHSILRFLIESLILIPCQIELCFVPPYPFYVVLIASYTHPMFIFYHSNNVYVLFDDPSRSLLLLKKHLIPILKISMNGGGKIIQLFSNPDLSFCMNLICERRSDPLLFTNPQWNLFSWGEGCEEVEFTIPTEGVGESQQQDIPDCTKLETGFLFNPIDMRSSARKE